MLREQALSHVVCDVFLIVRSAVNLPEEDFHLAYLALLLLSFIELSSEIESMQPS